MIRAILPGFLLVAACESLDPVEGDAPCVEVGYAIARRTLDCTGDAELANARYAAYDRAATCIEVEWALPAAENQYLVEPRDQPGNWFHCSFAISQLACELVDAHGDDLSSWLGASPMCDDVVELEVE